MQSQSCGMSKSTKVEPYRLQSTQGEEGLNNHEVCQRERNGPPLIIVCLPAFEMINTKSNSRLFLLRPPKRMQRKQKAIFRQKHILFIEWIQLTL